jgi:hypothetical protein
MQVELSVMYSQRPAVPVELEIRSVPFGVRVLRSAGLLLGLVVLGVFVTVLPLLHLCGAGLLLVVAPVSAWVAWKTTVVTVGLQRVGCPKCAAVVAVDEAKRGWPIRLQCEGCGSSLRAMPVR